MNLCPHSLANPGMCPDCRAADRRRSDKPPADIHRALAELVALALAVRPDWPEADIRAALAGAHAIGHTWEQALVGLARLMVDGRAVPRELVPNARDPLALHRVADPEVAHRGAGYARGLLEERTPAIDQPDTPAST